MSTSIDLNRALKFLMMTTTNTFLASCYLHKRLPEILLGIHANGVVA